MSAIACGASGTRASRSPAEQPQERATRDPVGAGLAAPPAPLAFPPAKLRTFASDPRFLILERPEIHAAMVMILPRAEVRLELLAVLEAWLKDKTALTRPVTRQLPCAPGAVCLTVAPSDVLSVVQRVGHGIQEDKDGVGRALLEARARLSEIGRGPSGVAELVLASPSPPERSDPLSPNTPSQSELGSVLQALLDQAKVCLVVPDPSTLPSSQWADLKPDPRSAQGAREEKVNAAAPLFLVQDVEKPLIAWSIRGTDAQGKLSERALAAELVLTSLKKHTPTIKWSRFESISGAYGFMEGPLLATAIQDLMSGLPPHIEEFSALELRGVESTIRLMRADFAACEPFAASAALEQKYRVEWLILGPASLARALKAAGTPLVEIPAP